MGKRTTKHEGVSPQAEHDLIAAREGRLDDSARERSERYGHRASADATTLSEEGLTAMIDREALRDDNGMTTADKVRTEWAGSRQPLRPGAEGRAAEPAGNHPASPLGVRVPDSMGGHLTEPRGEVTVQWHTPGPLASALSQHISGKATVSIMDQMTASTPDFPQQLGDRAPMGASGMVRDMPVGTSSNQPGGATGPAPRPAPMPAGRTGPNDPTADTAIRAATQRDYARPFHPPAPNRAPGSEWTSRVPGAD